MELLSDRTRNLRPGAFARAAALLAVVCAPARALDEEPGVVVPEAVRAALSEVGGPASVPAGELAHALVRLGPGAVAPLIRVLEQGELSAARGPALERALRELPGAVVGMLPECGAGERSGARRVGLAVLARAGPQDPVELACQLALPLGDGEEYDALVLQELELALQAVLERDPEAFRAVRRQFRRVDPVLHPALVNAVGATCSEVGMELLTDLLGVSSELDGPILAQIARTASKLPQPFEWTSTLRVRVYLSSPEAGLRREAALALGRMEDFESVAELIGLLQDDARGVRENALWALRRMSRQKIGLDVEQWRVWYERESRWWHEEAPRLLGEVATGAEAEVVRALGLIARRRLFRHELARTLVATIDGSRPSIVRATCSALESLGSTVAVPGLMRLLVHEDEGVRLKARRTIEAITGAPPGPPVETDP